MFSSKKLNSVRLRIFYHSSCRLKSILLSSISTDTYNTMNHSPMYGHTLPFMTQPDSWFMEKANQICS